MTPSRLLAGGRKWRFAALVANGCAQAAAATVAAFAVRGLFNRLVRHWRTEHAANVVGPLLVVLTAGLVIAMLKARERIDADLVGFDYTNEVRLDLFDHLAALSPSALERRSEGIVLLRFIGDLTALKLWISHGLSKLITAAATSVCILVAVALLCPPAALAAFVSLGLGCGAVLALGGPLERAVRASRKERGTLSGLTVERVIAMRTVQGFGGAEAEHGLISRRAAKLRHAIFRRALVAGSIRGVAFATTAVTHVAVLLAGGAWVVSGHSTAGAVVASLGLVGPMVPLVHDLGHVFELWHSGRVCQEKVDQLLAAGPLIEAGAEAEPLRLTRGEIRFEKVSVPGVLEAVDLTVAPRSVVAVTGDNGAGKSTLLALVGRLIAPGEGRVLLDGQDVAAVTRSSLRDAVGIVSADLPLLRGSVEMNLRYRRPDASPEELAQVARLCGIEHLLTAGPNGKPKKLRDRGRNLSVGERQRVLLARALLGSPPILVLDEAEANLDETLSARVQQLLTGYPGTVLMVTHRPSWIRRADRVWRIEGGRVFETSAGSDRVSSAPPGDAPRQVA